MRLLVAVVVVLTGMLVAACGNAQPQTITIGIINIAPAAQPVINEFKAGMADLGYAEDVNLAYLYEGPVSLDGLDAAIQNVIEADVDLIVTISTLVTLKVKRATEGSGIPVVFLGVYDPVRSGVVESLIRPGGNLTGVRVGGAIPKQLQLLLDIVPGATRLFVLHQPDDNSSVQSFADLQQAAAKLGIELVVSEVRTSNELLLALESVPEDVDAYFHIPSGLVAAHATAVARTAVERKLLVTAPAMEAVRLGGLMSYGPDLIPVGRQGSRLAAKILVGIPPADLPVETAEFFLGINIRTASAIGVDIPDDILQQADEIIR